jgi:hypothetical protein
MINNLIVEMMVKNNALLKIIILKQGKSRAFFEFLNQY